MRILLGSRIVGNQRIFAINVTAANCTYSGDSTINILGGTASISFEASAGYTLPATVSVSGATAQWDSSTGVLLLSNATGTVVVEATADHSIYGVSGLYQSSPILTRTDSAVGMSAVVDNSTGLVTSDFDNAFPWNEATRETINGNVFVHMPDMWFRVGRDTSDRITDVAVSKARGNSGNWYKVDSFYYGCYGGSISNNKLASVPGVGRQASKTRAETRAYANNNGSGYFQLDLYHHTVMMFLWWIEFATKHSQSIMHGNDSGSSPINTGGTDNLTTQSGFNTATNQMRWHYIEDYIGNFYEIVDGSVIDGNPGGAYYVTADTSKFNDNGEGMETLSYTFPLNASADNKCISAFGWDDDNPFLCEPKEQTGTDFTIYFCSSNYVNHRSSMHALSCGASYVSGVHAKGVSCCVRNDASEGYYDLGSRLLYKQQ